MFGSAGARGQRHSAGAAWGEGIPACAPGGIGAFIPHKAAARWTVPRFSSGTCGTYSCPGHEGRPLRQEDTDTEAKCCLQGLDPPQGRPAAGKGAACEWGPEVPARAHNVVTGRHTQVKQGPWRVPSGSSSSSASLPH